jgi:type IV secretory pathway VirD2 relaxase
MAEEKEEKLKIRAKAPKDEKKFKSVLRSAHSILKSSRRGQQNSNATRNIKPIRVNTSAQKCAVRLTYTSNKVAGHWAAHGKYLEREAATQNQAENGPGFGSDGEQMDIPAILSAWQQEGDPHLFKMIVSPEFGEDMDLRAHTADLIKSMEEDLGTKLQWVAADHYNTDHPHSHVVIRGVDEKGKPLRLPPAYIKQGVRMRAQHHATRQLGLRGPQEEKKARERQVNQQRMTDLDRTLIRKSEVQPDGSRTLRYPDQAPTNPDRLDVHLTELRRIRQLKVMGLAESVDEHSYRLKPGFDQTLLVMGQASDRLKSLHEHAEMLSDAKMPFVVSDVRREKALAGRVIGTGLDEAAAKPYLLLEGVDGKVHYLYHDKGIEDARGRGDMNVGHFVTIEQKLNRDSGAPRMETRVKDFGNAEKLLAEPKHFQSEAMRYVGKHRQVPGAGTHAGWLGKYQHALHRQGAELVASGRIRATANGHEVARTTKQPPQRGR